MSRRASEMTSTDCQTTTSTLALRISSLRAMKALPSTQNLIMT